MSTQRYVLMSLLLICLVFSLGLGSKQDNKIPIPLDHFSATIVDRAGVKTIVTDVSIEGRTFFISQHGKGVLFVEFNDIREVRFSESAKGDEVTVTMTLVSGETMQGTLKGNDNLFGVAKFGKFKIRVKEIESIMLEFIE
ncbi:hypothetical protein JXQ70_05690 [bacterium]|nr:hypothetical protein [bacterium]